MAHPDDDSHQLGAVQTAAGEDDPAQVAATFQRDLYLYWRAVQSVPAGLPLTARDYLTRQGLRRVYSRLAAAEGRTAESPATELEDERLFFLRRLLERLGLLRRAEGDSLIAAPRAEIERYLAHPLGERLRICARLWVAGGWWPDRPDPRVLPPRPLVPAPPRIALVRRRLLDSLAELPPGGTLPLPREPLAPTAPRPVRTRGKPGAARQSTDRAGEAATQRAALLGPLRWLGFVACDEETAAHATVTVATCALRPQTPPDAVSEPRGPITALPNLTVIAYPPLAAPALLLLDGCADLEALDQTARYRLSRVAFTRARAGGLSAGALAARLESLSSTPLPQNVRATLDDWTRHAERLRLTLDVTVLEVRAPDLLDALLAEPSATAWVERRLTPTVALLAPGATAAVRTWLLRRGELPALVEHSRDG